MRKRRDRDSDSHGRGYHSTSLDRVYQLTTPWSVMRYRLQQLLTAMDNCDTSVTVDFTETVDAGACSNSFVLTRTWTAIDNCGNTGSESQIITVEDTTAPVLLGVPGDETVECDAVPSPPAVTATDNCDPSPVVSFNETITPGSCTDTFTVTRVWSATDDCGNIASPEPDDHGTGYDCADHRGRTSRYYG